MERKLHINPWLSIWTKPRETIREIIAFNPKYRFILLSGIYGLPVCFQFAQSLSLAEVMGLPLILALSFVLAIVVGMIGITIFTALLTWTGKWIGGKGDFQEVRATVAWSNVPSVVDIAAWLIMIAAFGQRLFLNIFPSMQFLGGAQALIMTLFFAQLIASIWSLVIFLMMLSEVQKFSIWKAILNLIIPFAIILGALMLIGWIMGLSSQAQV